MCFQGVIYFSFLMLAGWTHYLLITSSTSYFVFTKSHKALFQISNLILKSFFMDCIPADYGLSFEQIIENT